MNDTNRHDAPGDISETEVPKKSPSPVMTDTKPQADEATFRIIGDAGPLFGALALAQGAFQPITKNRTVTVKPEGKASYTFDYATLDQVLAATVPALSANGLALLQPFYHGPNGLELRTILAHSSGARLEAVTELPKSNTIQAAGSALTYLKRYQVQAILGVSSEEDDDGNAADGNQVQASTPRDRSKPPEPPKRQGQAKNGSTAQSSSKPAEVPKPAQDEPAPAKAPEPQPESQTPPAAATGERRGLSPEQLQKLGGLLKDPARKWNRGQIDQLLSGLFNKGHAELTAADGDHVIAVLEQAARADYQADQLLSMMQEFSTAEQPNPEAVIKALDAEGTAFP